MEQIKSPQLEDGYTRIANELLEALAKHPFSGAELKVLLTIARFSYGWQEKTVRLSYGRLAQYTSVSRVYVCKIIKNLEKEKVIFVFRQGYINSFGINKNYTQWLCKVRKSKNRVLSKILPQACG